MGAGVPRGLQNRLREAQNLPDEFDPHTPSPKNRSEEVAEGRERERLGVGKISAHERASDRPGRGSFLIFVAEYTVYCGKVLI